MAAFGILRLAVPREVSAEVGIKAYIAAHILLVGLLGSSSAVLIRSSSRIKDGSPAAFWGIVTICGAIGASTVLVFFPIGLLCLSAVFATYTRTSRAWMASRRARQE